MGPRDEGGTCTKGIRGWWVVPAVLAIILLPGLAGSASAGPGAGDIVEGSMGGSIRVSACFNVTNGAPKGMGIYGFHLHVADGAIGGPLGPPSGWTAAAYDTDVYWITTTAPIKMHGSLDGFCVSVRGGPMIWILSVEWTTADHKGNPVNSGTISLFFAGPGPAKSPAARCG